ncbi:hypothetical protein [Sphingomonas radiodurans]|uniref:hypothetical protein n=1 Tax=Sphingomonas radiodurans TaxID=2890321 RepID=UPI001E60E965|nr:hypothetical protein [Sphingomonas radiodurans]WBH17991.1 hypothetical protein LLW23_07840 [Sphingomonas radiodurans]
MRVFAAALTAQALALASAATAQGAPGVPSVQPNMSGMSGDAADRFMDRQTNYRRLDEDVSGSARSLRPVPARPKDVAQGVEVRDAKGLVVGTVAKVDSGVAVVSSERGSVEVDVSSFAKNKNGLLINLPKAKIDAMMTGKPAS